MAPPLARLFAGPHELRRRVEELGSDVAKSASRDLLLVTMLHGGVPFLADLVRHLSPTVEVDFMRLSPYEEGEHPPGTARIVKDLDQPIVGRDVLVVEDVVDTGLSLGFLLRNLNDRDPASVRICTLLDRATKRLVDVPVAHRGFEIASEFLVGYGLDFLGLYRNVPALVAVDDLEALRDDPFAVVSYLREWGIWQGKDVAGRG